MTGGAGFIGSHLVDGLISHGWTAVALDDLSTGSNRNIRHLLDHPGFSFVEGSVMDTELVDSLVSESDIVFHLAAAVGVQLIVDRPLQSLLTNIRGTEVVLEAAERHRVKTLLSSTSEIYGKSQNGPFKEDDDRVLGSPRKLRWSYSTSKAVDEILAYVYFKDKGLPTIVARLFNTIGPRQTGHYGMVVPRFIAQALRGEPLTVYGDGKQSRVFTDVADVVDACMRLASEPKAEGGVFNIAAQEEITIKDIAKLVIDKTHSKSNLVYVPYEKVYGEGFEDMTRRFADTTRLEETIGYRCTTALDDTLDRMIAYERDMVQSL
ncbi:MAG: NAD-dependent epimerase/dehydratase family protein [Candidatus Dormibacteraceae bacterium]